MKMLVLSRKVGESIQIGDNVVVSILEVKGGRVRLSFDAPKDVSILREELVVQLQQHQEFEPDSPSEPADRQCVA